MNLVYIHKDEYNAIVLCRDSFKAVSVQLVRFTDQQVPNADGVLVTHRRSMGLWKLDVPVTGPKGGKLGDEKFKTKVGEAIGKAKAELAKVQKSDSIIEGVLNDYLSQNKGINHVAEE